jgi:hypothetical protein
VFVLLRVQIRITRIDFGSGLLYLFTLHSRLHFFEGVGNRELMRLARRARAARAWLTGTREHILLRGFETEILRRALHTRATERRATPQSRHDQEPCGIEINNALQLHARARVELLCPLCLWRSEILGPATLLLLLRKLLGVLFGFKADRPFSCHFPVIFEPFIEFFKLELFWTLSLNQ